MQDDKNQYIFPEQERTIFTKTGLIILFPLELMVHAIFVVPSIIHKNLDDVWVSLFFAIIFGVSVLGMFAINAISGNNINIINYREQLLDEYSGWEQELKTEEERLEKWEELLEQRENQLREEMNGGE